MKKFIFIAFLLLSQMMAAQSYWDYSEKFSFSVLGGGTNLTDSDSPDFCVYGASATIYNIYGDFIMQPSDKAGVKFDASSWHVGYRFNVKYFGITPVFGLSSYHNTDLLHEKKTKNRSDFGIVLDESFFVKSKPYLKVSVGITKYNLYAGLGVRF